MVYITRVRLLPGRNHSRDITHVVLWDEDTGLESRCRIGQVIECMRGGMRVWVKVGVRSIRVEVREQRRTSFIQAQDLHHWRDDLVKLTRC